MKTSFFQLDCRSGLSRGLYMQQIWYCGVQRQNHRVVKNGMGVCIIICNLLSTIT